MADLSLTAASVIAGSNAVRVQGILGGTVTSGAVVYKEALTGKWKLADNDAVTAEVRQAIGIALNGASVNQPTTIQTAGDITLGAVLTAGTAYYLSNTPGGICPLADVGAGEFVVLLGIAKTTSVLALDIQYPGVSL